MSITAAPRLGVRTCAAFAENAKRAEAATAPLNATALTNGLGIFTLRLIAMLHNLFHNVNSCLMLLSRLRHGTVAEGELGHPLKRIFDAKRDIYSEKNRFRGKKTASTRDSSAKKL
ncbi:MAG TPA: hypothetical protein PK586_08310 [Casimicrobium sp.]|nr:hypothetical protein [Casimicrobium sp.]